MFIYRLYNIFFYFSHIDDVDLITGAMSEIHVPGGVVGRTFACLLGNQFRNSKFADRFHYENPLETTGFSLGESADIYNLATNKLYIKLIIYFCPGICQTTQTTQKLVHFYMLITLKHKSS